ncbi:MAG: DivIVA domain-containing protein, partial [Fischerella sp.]|nr:DivIVA domain-containing protein [Fischerella sp.]
MLRPKPSRIEPDQNGNGLTPAELNDEISYEHSTAMRSVDIQLELNRLEEIILSSFHVPLTRHALVDEEKLLEQLDFIRLSLPSAFAEATEILLSLIHI